MIFEQKIGLVFCLILLAPEIIRSATLSSSGNPIRGANPSRNRQVNKKLLCTSVAPGRTQIWNIAWQSVPPGNWFAEYGGDIELTQDDEGFIYVHGTIEGLDPNSKIIKINGTDGSYDASLINSTRSIRSDVYRYEAPFAATYAVPTHVKGNIMYIAAPNMTAIVNTTTMKDIAVLQHENTYSTEVPGSYAPLGDQFMVSANTNQDPVNILRYLNISALQFDPDQPNLSSAYADEVIIYRNGSGADVPIVVLLSTERFYAGTITVWSPNYQFTIPGNNLVYDTGYVQNSQLVIQYYNDTDFSPTLAFYDADTGVLTQNVTKNVWENQTESFFGPVFVFGNKSIGDVGSFEGSKLIDLLNGKTIMFDRDLQMRPLYSIPDNTVLTWSQRPSMSFPPQEMISIDWDTDHINGIGGFPSDANFGDIYFSSPLIGDDCTVYAYLDDQQKYRGTLFGFKPMPVAEVVPILECINADGLAYFSYHNLEDKRIIIPQVLDRNNLEPMDLSPAREFRALKRGKYFPLSSRVILDNTTTSFNWRLEDYVLSFNNTAKLRCPKAAVPSGFAEWTRQAFVSIMGISDWRVTVVTTKKRDSVSDLEVELQVVAANTTQELTPEQSVQQFVEEQVYQYTQQLASDPTYAPSNITLIDIDGGGSLDTEISGNKQPYSQPLSQAPVSAPTSSQEPTSSNNNNSTPKASEVSTAMVLLASHCLIALSVVSLFV